MVKKTTHYKEALLPTATQSPVQIDLGAELFFLGLDQFRTCLQRIALGKEHFHVIRPGRLKQLVGNFNRFVERSHLLQLESIVVLQVVDARKLGDDLLVSIQNRLLVFVGGLYLAVSSAFC